MPIVTIKKSNFPSDLGISSMSNADALVMSVLIRECPRYMPRLSAGVFFNSSELDWKSPIPVAEKKLWGCF